MSRADARATSLQGVGVGRRRRRRPGRRRCAPAPHVAADAPLLVDGVRGATSPTAHAPSSSSRSPTSPRACGSSRRGPTGTVQAVLAATALMARGPGRCARSVLARIDAGRAGGHRGRPARRGVLHDVRAGRRLPRRAGHRPARRPRPHRRHGARACRRPACPTLTKPSVIVAKDLAPADTADARPGPRASAIVTELGGPTEPHRDHRRRSSACRASCGSPARRRSPTARDVAVDARRRHRHPRPRPSASARRSGAARDASSGAQDGHRRPARPRDGHAVALLANIGTVEDAERVAGGGRRGRRPVPHRGAVPRAAPRRRPSTTRRPLHAGASRRSATARSSSARSTPAPTSRWPSRPQPDEENPALGVRGYRLVRTHPAAAGHPARGARPRAGQETGADAVGHGADDRHRARGARRSPRRVRRTGCRDGRHDDRGAGGRAARAGRSSTRSTSSRSAPTTSPSTRWPPTGCAASWPTCSTRGSRPCSTWSTRPRARGPAGAQARRRLRRVRVAIRCSRWCSSGSASPACRCPPGPSPRSGTRCGTTPPPSAPPWRPPRSRHRRRSRGGPRWSGCCTRTCGRRLGV